MKKKILSIATCAAFAACAMIGGSLAYFTDTDNATNTFTVGGVKIALHESNKESDLAQGEELAIDDDYQEWLEDQVLMPGDSQTNTVSKVVTVENTGKSNSYVRVHIAIPSVLDDAQPNFDASKNLLHFNAYADSYTDGFWNWGKKVTTDRTSFVGSGDTWNYYTTTINNISYNVYVVTYETALAPEDTTAKSAMHQVYLYKDVTNADIDKANETLKGDWNIYVAAEGTQTEGFTDAFDALNTSFGTPGSYPVAWTTVVPTPEPTPTPGE